MRKQLDNKEAVSKPELYTVLCGVILEVLKSWENQKNVEFDAMWYGYEALLDEVKEKGTETTLKDLKKSMKILRERGVVELKPTYDSEWTMCGSGYFIEPTYNAI